MHRIRAIFLKDARHLWPQVALLLCLMALAAILDPTYSRTRVPYYDFLPLLMLPLGCWLVIVSVIHEEKLPGDRQYWLTRPYCWKELLTAKLLFVAVFVNLPLLLCHAAVFVLVKIPIADQIASLLWRQVFFTAFYVLPVAALASVTRSIGRMIAAALLGGVGVWLSESAFVLLTRRPLMVHEGTHEATVFRAAILAAGASAVLVLQYARRRTHLAAGLAATCAVALLLPVFLGPAFGSRSPAGGQPVRLSLGLDPDRQAGAVPGVDPDLLTLEVPVRLNRVPEGVLLDRARIRGIRIQAAGRPQRLLRVTEGQLHDLDTGRAWLSLFTDPRLLSHVQGMPVSISGSFELRLFGSPRVLPLPKGRAVTVREVGVCHDFLEPDGSIAFSCYSASPHAAVLIGTPGVRANWIIPPGFASRSIPTAGGFQPLTRFVSLLSYRDWEQVGPAKLVAAEPLPPLRVDFRLAGVHLPAYPATRSN
jgi:hypothetical protein